MKRYQVAHKHELRDGEMKQVTAGETELLLVQLNGRLHALYAHCTHYGAPLAEGALSGSRIICPWHHACFAAATGELLEPPALDDLPTFEVELEGDAVFALLPDPVPEKHSPEVAPPKLTPSQLAADAGDGRVFVILGAGAAGAAAAEALRREGFSGRVLLVTQAELPYDRTLLSKDYLAEEKTMDWIPMRDAAFYEAHGAELLLGRKITRLDADEQTLTFADGATLAYDALLLATGSVPKPLDIPGTHLSGVHYLRTLDNSQTLIAAAKKARRAVVIGSSFIGMECAASLRTRGLGVSVVTPDAVPFERVLGLEVGGMFAALHEENGVELFPERQAVRLVGRERVTQVVLDDNTVLEADLVVIGVGVAPATDFLVGAPKNDDGSLSVDQHLRVAGVAGLYAAGDLARYPDPKTGEPMRVEHWRLAMQHGRTAAANMLGKAVSFDGVPFFWTKQFGFSLRYLGHARGEDEVVTEGSLGARDFLAYYLRDERVVAAAGAQRDAELAAIEACMQLGKLPSADEVRRQKVDWLARL